MKILVTVIIIFFLLSSHPISAQVNAALIDDFFHSLPTKVYYWRIEETSYESTVLKSFNAVVLKRSGLADKYLFQESDMVVIEKESKDKIFISLLLFSRWKRTRYESGNIFS